MTDKRPIFEDYYLSQVQEADKPKLIYYLNNQEITKMLLQLPYPYTAADADWWIKHNKQLSNQQGKVTKWQIYKQSEGLIGGIGFHGDYTQDLFKDDIGYWLTPPFWGKGIMTEAVKKICEIGFEELGLRRIEAGVFVHNPASGRVLEKAGFQFEGCLRNYHKKGDVLLDSMMYARVI